MAAGSQQVRLIVRGKSYADQTCQVSFMRQYRYLGQSRVTPNRDLDMEWALLRLIDPEYAASIEQAGAPTAAF